MHHPTDRIAHTTAFVIPVVEHWLEREIAEQQRQALDGSQALCVSSEDEISTEHFNVLSINLFYDTLNTFLFMFISASERFLHNCV